jgi:hypothetical protein
MAELLDLNINIGANTTDFESSLQKAQNLLRQFEAALKKATNVGEINYLNNQIKNLNATIGALGQQMNKVGRPAGDATNSLMNLSRVAQDAPYGFIGIANNLNPLLESFQRLQKESGSSANALKSMVAGLTGPAGIGLALGVVSSLAVTFGKDIAAFFKGPTEKLKEFRAELAKISQDLYKVVGEAQANRTIGLNLVSVIAGGTAAQQEEALKKLKVLYRDSKDIQALKIGADTTYMTHLVNMASKQEEYNAKEKNNAQALNIIYDNQKKVIDERDKALKAVKGDIVTGGGPGGGASVVTEEQQIQSIKNKYNPILKELEKQIVSAKTKNLELVTALSVFETPDVKGGTKKEGSSPIVNYAREENKALNLELAKMKALREKMKQIGLEPLQLFELPSDARAAEKKRQGYFQGREKDLLEQSNQSGFGALMQGMYKKDKSKIEGEDAENKRLQDLTKSYQDFAYTISGSVTNALMGMYDAMQQGQSPLEAIGQMFANIGRQIAAAVIQALIFKALLDAFPELKGVFTAVGGVGKGIGGLLGLASGGVATGPTLAMIGEGRESEAVLPLSKLGGMLNTTFNAGSMSGGSSGGYGGFVLRGQDLLLSVNRAQKASNLKGQNISLA